MFKDKERIKALKEQNRQLKNTIRELRAENDDLYRRMNIIEKACKEYEDAIKEAKECKEMYLNLMAKMKEYNSKLKEKYKIK